MNPVNLSSIAGAFEVGLGPARQGVGAWHPSVGVAGRRQVAFLLCGKESISGREQRSWELFSQRQAMVLFLCRSDSLPNVLVDQRYSVQNHSFSCEVLAEINEIRKIY